MGLYNYVRKVKKDNINGKLIDTDNIKNCTYNDFKRSINQFMIKIRSYEIYSQALTCHKKEHNEMGKNLIAKHEVTNNT